MQIRRLIFACVLLTLALRVTCCLAIDGPQPAILGPAEPIGMLLLASTAEVSFEPLPMPEFPQPIAAVVDPDLGTPILLASLNATVSTATVPVMPPHPQEIQQPLRQAAETLAAAGLHDEARQILDLLAKLERDQFRRLLLQRKEVELASLQAEVDELRQRLAGEFAKQISLSIQIIERTVKRDALANQPQDETNANQGAAPAAAPKLSLPGIGVMESTEFAETIRALREHGEVKILSVPQMTLLSGRSGRYSSGGKLTLPEHLQKHGQTEIEFGTSVLAIATIIESDRIRLTAHIDHKELDHANAANGIPGISRRRVQSTVELADGQTLVLGGFVSGNDETTTETLFTVTTEIVRPLPGDMAPLPAVFDPKFLPQETPASR